MSTQTSQKTYEAYTHAKEVVKAQPPQIKPGDTIPDVRLIRLNTKGDPESFSTKKELSGKLVVLLMVPGPFTPTCSKIHLPGFAALHDAFKKAGVEKIACIAVSTPDVLSAWGQQNDPQGRVGMIADWGAEFVWKMGLTIDKSERGLGIVAKRTAMILQNGIVKDITVEADAGQCGITSAASILERIGSSKAS
ncbi:MAG TPA: peroxiredoxin [Chlamydiales bacterium]|nr:peroxiredoxin [Chlamydiales bacterium]